ncbi:MAG: HD domain-containing phosphohydrolase [Candidatus Bipolaricaulia bacterium]
MQGLSLHRSSDAIDTVRQGQIELRLLAHGDDLEVSKITIPPEQRFSLYPPETGNGKGHEFLYILAGELTWTGEDEQIVLQAGDYIFFHNLQKQAYFKAETEVTLLHMLSEPAFHLERKEIKDLISLVQEVERKDEYTEEHCGRIEGLSIKTGEKLGLSADRLENLASAAYLHDLGKAGISEHILGKAGELTEAEREEIRKHPSIGRQMAQQKSFLKEAGRIIEQHHERVDGKGYPKGLSGEEISLEARIIAVVDAYDAMTTDRPYRDALSEAEAIAELHKNSGTQFDEQVVGAFLDVLSEEEFQEPIINRRSGQRLERKLLGVGEELLSIQDVNEILDRAIDAITQHSRFRRAVISLYERPVPVLQIEEANVVKIATSGLTQEEEKKIKQSSIAPKVRKQIVDDRFKLNRSYYIPQGRFAWDPETVVRRSRMSVGEIKNWYPGDALFIPLYVGDRILGFISVDDPIDGRAPIPKNLELIEIFANLIAIAIQDARFETRIKRSYPIGQV